MFTPQEEKMYKKGLVIIVRHAKSSKKVQCVRVMIIYWEMEYNTGIYVFYSIYSPAHTYHRGVIFAYKGPLLCTWQWGPFTRTTMFLPLPRKDKKQYILQYYPTQWKNILCGSSSSVCKIKVDFLILTYKSNPKPKYLLKTKSSVQETFIGGILERYVCR